MTAPSGRRCGADLSLLDHGLEERPTVIGKTVRLESWRALGHDCGRAGAVGAVSGETEIIANVVTSPHHLSATMVTGRVHRMTELFGRLRRARRWSRHAPN